MQAKKVDISTLPDMQSIPVRTAIVHQPVNVAGIIGADKTIQKSKYPGLEMHWTPVGLVLERDGNMAIIPHANCGVAVVDRK